MPSEMVCPATSLMMILSSSLDTSMDYLEMICGRASFITAVPRENPVQKAVTSMIHTGHSAKKATATASDIIYNEGLNMYNLYGDCPGGSLGNGNFTRYEATLSHLFRNHPNHHTRMRKLRSTRINNNLQLDPPCTDSSNMQIYLNTPEVRTALHIPEHVGKWEICNDQINFNYNRQYDSMEEQYKFLQPRLRGLVYNGDIDMACNFLGDEWFVEALGLKVIEKRRMWHQGGQVGGFVKRFQNLDLLTIRGAGHMVPQDKPGPALKMISSFIFKKDY